MPIRATRTYLHMTAPPVKASPDAESRLRIERLEPGGAAVYRQLYSAIGRNHHWTDRVAWTDREIELHLARPGLSVFVLYDGERPAGYFELAADGRSTEIAYFGLVPAFIGRGLGKMLLAAAIDHAWATGAARVWLHTSTLDHPAALSNYLKRGFTPYRTETYEVQE